MCIAEHYIFNLAYHKKTTKVWSFEQEKMIGQPSKMLKRPPSVINHACHWNRRQCNCQTDDHWYSMTQLQQLFIHLFILYSLTISRESVNIYIYIAIHSCEVPSGSCFCENIYLLLQHRQKFNTFCIFYMRFITGTHVRNAHTRNANGDLTRTIIVVTGICYSFVSCVHRVYSTYNFIHAYAKTHKLRVSRI